MKTRIAVLAALVAVLFMSTIILAQSSEPVAQPTWYSIKQGVASGEGYRVTSLAWQVEGSASGEGYSLSAPAQITLRGNGCCCVFIPWVLGNQSGATSKQ